MSRTRWSARRLMLAFVIVTGMIATVSLATAIYLPIINHQAVINICNQLNRGRREINTELIPQFSQDRGNLQALSKALANTRAQEKTAFEEFSGSARAGQVLTQKLFPEFADQANQLTKRQINTIENLVKAYRNASSVDAQINQSESNIHVTPLPLLKC